jgi:hypothetical protein
MNLTLPLPPELEDRLAQEASRLGVAPADYALRLLEEHVPAANTRHEIVSLLQSWVDEPDAEEQKQTGNYLIRALDEERTGERKLFPPELEGVTW